MLIQLCFDLAPATNPPPCANERDLSKQVWLYGKRIETLHILLRLDVREIEMGLGFDHNEMVTQYHLSIQ